MARDRTLLGDIGGTNVRFAVLAGDTLGPIDHLQVSAHRSLRHAIDAYLGNRQDRGRIGAAVLGVAGPVESGRSLIVNSQWMIDAAELRDGLGFKSIILINDFEAMACALPYLNENHLKRIAGDKPSIEESMAVIGPGTGLGMAGVVRSGDRPIVIPTEGGHATLPSVTAREDAVIAYLRSKFDHVSGERALSGPGLENLHSAIAAIDGIAVPTRTAAEITRQALDRSCPVSVAAVDMFCAMLGTVAGNLALMFRARDGVYIAGGIVPRLVDVLARSQFRARFVAKGRFQPYLESIPITVIINSDAAFLGLKSLAPATSSQ